jgi:hypothetical protein
MKRKRESRDQSRIVGVFGTTGEVNGRPCLSLSVPHPVSGAAGTTEEAAD